MGKQRSRGLRLAALVVVGATVLSACGRAEETSGGESTDGGIPTSPGFDGETISLGIITVTSGPIAPVTEPLSAAQQAWEKYVNANGGIGGYQVKLNVTDSGYNPAQAIQQYERTKNDVVMYANVFGTPIAQTLLPKLKADKILAEVATGDGSLLRQQETNLMFTPFESQIIEGVDFGVNASDQGKDAVVCGAALEGPLAETAETALDYAADELGVTIGTVVSVAQTATDATPQVLQLQDADCDVVVIQAVPGTTTALTSAASKLGYTPQFVTTSTGFSAVFDDSPIYEYLAENLLITSDVIPFGDDSADGMAALVEAHEMYAKDTVPSASFVQGWVGMLAVQSVLEEAVKNRDLSHEGIIEASNSLTTFDLQGIGPVWGWGAPDERTAPESFTVYRPDAEQASGISVVEATVPAPDAAVNYPY
jgi:ABC-type branched-subunit amino acid transport system substrate-binding protein